MVDFNSTFKFTTDSYKTKMMSLNDLTKNRIKERKNATYYRQTLVVFIALAVFLVEDHFS